MAQRRANDLHILILSWRDRTHPQGGGSEVFAETVAAGLVRRGHRVTLACAAHPGAPAVETSPDGVRVVRAGGRFGVYPRAAWKYLSGGLGRPDVILDVQNGIPFFARLWSRRPVVVLCHHVHREQWAVVMGPMAARLGWWLESWLAPRVNRSAAYVTVSDVSAAELTELGVQAQSIRVVHNGTPPSPASRVRRTENPSLCVLGRLVPHKRVEVALEAVAELKQEFPGLALTIAGQGWWEQRLREYAETLGVQEDVALLGWVEEERKHELLGSSWVNLVPSLKEGWGIAVMEAAAHGTPSVAFRDAGGVADSIHDGVTGLLADDHNSFVAQVRRLLLDGDLRRELGDEARRWAGTFTWDITIDAMEAALLQAAGHAGAVTASTRSTLPRSLG